jgi:hypothetical protein
MWATWKGGGNVRGEEPHQQVALGPLYWREGKTLWSGSSKLLAPPGCRCDPGPADNAANWRIEVEQGLTGVAVSYADAHEALSSLTAEGTCWHPSFVRNAMAPLHQAEKLGIPARNCSRIKAKY